MKIAGGGGRGMVDLNVGHDSRGPLLVVVIGAGEGRDRM